jgi:MFS family permease
MVVGIFRGTNLSQRSRHNCRASKHSVPFPTRRIAHCGNNYDKMCLINERGVTLVSLVERQSDTKMRWRILAFLAIALVFSWSTWFSASAVIPQLRSIWSLSPSSSAWLTIAVQIGFVVGAVISSLFNIADLLSPRFVIMVGAIGAAIANALLLVSGGPQFGIPLRLATGFFLAGVYPPAFKLLSTWFRENRGLALGILASALVVGGGVPHLINGLGDWTGGL